MKRASVLTLLSDHPHTTALPRFPAHMHISTSDRALTPWELFSASAADTVQEAFHVGTAAVVITAALVGWQSPRLSTCAGTEAEVVEVVLPPAGWPGCIAQARWERLMDIQEAHRGGLVDVPSLRCLTLAPACVLRSSPDPFPQKKGCSMLGADTTARSEV